MATYSQEIRWHVMGGVAGVIVENCASPKEAMAKALEQAKERGWTPPRWWQWSRRHDLNYEKLLEAAE
jgi:hypothetical protein